jgi:hypothetical protein
MQLDRKTTVADADNDRPLLAITPCTLCCLVAKCIDRFTDQAVEAVVVNLLVRSLSKM